MKNLKKVLALVVALTMVLGTVSFAAFTDVAEDSNVYTAVQTLSSLSILNGYEDGSFGPEKDITRAEFCAVVCRALGLGDPAKGATSFTDVAADHWASGYINLAAGQGIVNGYGNGLFGPEDNVTYEQAVKMLVVALGFEPMAAQKGGYPTGYLVVANTYGLTENVVAAGDAAPANRGVVAQLTYNALDIPMMAQTGFGTNVEYKIQDGNNGTKYQTLLTGLKVAKLGGIVEATKIIGGAAEGTISFRVNDNFDDTRWVEKEDTLGDNKNLYASFFKLAEGINADAYVGYAAEIFVKEVRGGWEVIAMMPGTDSETITIAKKDIKSLDEDKVEYWESATATKAKKLTLNGIANAIINNDDKVILSSGVPTTDYNNLSPDAEITFINNNTDSGFDKIVIKDYAYVIVDEVEADRNRFTTEDVTTYIFDFDTDGISNSILNKDGEAITLADFAEGDVLAVISDDDKTRDFGWIEVINLGQNVVTGTVTEKDGNKALYVDGVEYEITSDYLTKMSTLKPNTEGTFYLTKAGKVFDSEVTASVAGNFGYILEADYGKVGAFSETWQIRMLTKDGSIEIYTVSDKFTVNSGAEKSYTVGSDANTVPELLAIKQINSDAGVNGFKTTPEGKLVTFRLDTNNNLKELVFVDTDAVTTAKAYNADAQSVDKKYLASDVVIFNLTGNSKDDATVVSISTLVDETGYTGIVAKQPDSSETEYDCFVIITGAAAIDYTQDLAVVSAKSTVLVGEENATKISYYTSNDETLKEITFINDDVDLNGASTDDLVKGTVFMFAAGADGVATDIAVVAKYNAGKYVLQNGAKLAVENEEDNEFIEGFIYTMDKGNGGKLVVYSGDVKINSAGSEYDYSVTSAADESILVKSGANVYTFANNTSSDRGYIVVADWAAGDVDKEIYNTTTTKFERTYFVARVYDGQLKDIITLGDRVIE